MEDMILNINSEDYNYTMINNIYKKLSKKIADIRLDPKSNMTDKSRIFEGSFLLKSGSYSVNIEIIFFLHLIIMGYFIEFEQSEDKDLYKIILKNYINENVEYYEKEKEKIRGLYFENENKKEIYDAFIEIFKISEKIFILLTDKVKKRSREDILRKVISKFNFSDRELNDIFLERSPIDIKLEKCYAEIEKIFIPIFNEYYLDELDDRIYFLRILKDGIKTIYAHLIFDNEKSKKENLKIFFNDDTWFVYFYSIILSSYKENGINLLKLNKNMDFLKFGADTETINEIVKNFVLENNLENVSEELKPEIFYLLLGTGYYDKVVYDTDIMDKSHRFEIIPVNKNGDRIFDNGMKAYKLNMDFAIPDFVNMILASDNNNLKKYIKKFVGIFNDIENQINDEFEDEVTELESAIKDIFQNLEHDMIQKYNEIKSLYNFSKKSQKIYMIKEFINIFMNKINIKTNSRKNMIRNYEIILEALKDQMNYEIQIENDENLESRVVITHNLTDSLRLESEKNISEMLEKESEEKYKKYKEDSRINIKIRTGSDIRQEENTNLAINMKIFFYLTAYSKMMNDKYFLELDEKLREIYFNAVSDVMYMLNLKDSRLLQNLNFIEEYDYLKCFLEKTESYFLLLYLNDKEDIKKANPEITIEARKFLKVFKSALLDGYLYYEENHTGFLEEKITGIKREENQDIFINLEDKMDTLVRYFNLDEIFI